MKEKEKREDKPPFLDFSCLRSKTLQILLLSTSFTSFGINTPLFNLVIECTGEDVDRFSLVLLHIHVGLAWMVGCFLFGLIVIQKNQECRVSKQYLCQMASVVCGISIVALTAVEGYGGLVIFTWVYGFSLGGYNYALKVYTYERVRARHFPRAWSFVQCSQAIPVASGVALTGYINSVVGWKIGYYLSAVSVFLGTSFLFLTDVRRRRLSRRKTNNSSMKTNETTETVQSPKARKISFSFPVDPVPQQSKHDSDGQIAGIDPSLLAKELTCISEEGLIDMDFQDIYFEEWADYFGDCITSCNKVENCLLSEYDPEYAVLIEKRARRWSAVRPSFAQTALGATTAAVASGVVGVGTSSANGSMDANNGVSTSTNIGSTVAGSLSQTSTSSHLHHHLLAPGSFHIIPAQLSQISPHQLSIEGSNIIGAEGGVAAPLASGELLPDDQSNPMAPDSSGQPSGAAGVSQIRNSHSHQHPPRSGRRSTVEPPSRSITVIDEASV